MAAPPRFDPIKAGVFGGNTPSDHIGRESRACSECGKTTAHDLWKAILGVHVGVGLPFGRKSTVGKAGTRSEWAFCAECGTATPLNDAAQKALATAGYEEPQDAGSDLLDLLASDLAEAVLKRGSEEVAGTIFAAALDGESLDEAACQEWLALNLFAATRAVGSACDRQSVGRAVLDRLHDIVYASRFSTDSERERFEGLLQERYATYNQILATATSDHVLQIAQRFAVEIGRATDIRVWTTVAQWFLSSFSSVKEFLEAEARTLKVEL